MGATALALILLAANLGMAADPPAATNAPAQITIPPPPELPKAPQPVIPQQDRSQNSGAAQGAAIAGAAMAGAMCAMLMRQAMQEKDPQKKMMLMMMANQQCAQAAQSAQAANQNGQSKEKLTQNDSKVPELPKAQAFKSPEKPNETDLLKDLEKKNANDEKLDVAEVDRPKLPDVPNEKSESTPTPFSGNFEGQSVSALKPIENQNLTFKEESKGGGVTPTPDASPTTISVASMKNMTSEELKAILEAQRNKEFTGRNIAAINAPSGDTPAGSSAISPSQSGADLDGMLAALMGGGSMDMAGTGGPPNDVLVFDSKQASRENIFQYASYRYQRAASQEKSLQRNAKVVSQIVDY